jgi:hypothetical protein|tara:strand:- start:151 stop:459 length:309 start_codon:yes stop_codon:yes gene_type:complete
MIDKSIYDVTNKDPHQSLYVAVVLQALLDLSKPKLDNEKSSIKIERDQAHSWVFASIGVTCKDFKEICLYAGLSPNLIREAAKNLLNSKDVNNVRKTIKDLL